MPVFRLIHFEGVVIDRVDLPFPPPVPGLSMSPRTGVAVGTLALGTEYQALAQLLAQDVGSYHPGLTMFVFTDTPEAFVGRPGVVPVRHRQRSLWRPYHDKRFVLATLVRHAEVAVFLDADSRLLAPLPVADLLARPPSLISDSVVPMTERHADEIKAIGAPPARGRGMNPQKEWRLVSRMHTRLGLSPESTCFVKEHFLATCGDPRTILRFLSSWGAIALRLELGGLSFAEGNAIGMAAVLSGLSLEEHQATRSWLFKDLWTRPGIVPPESMSRVREYHDIRHAMARDYARPDGRFGRAVGAVGRLPRALMQYLIDVNGARQG